jgi:hypothetical protein
MTITRKNDPDLRFDFLTSEKYQFNPSDYDTTGHYSADRKALLIPGVYDVKDPQKKNGNVTYLFKARDNGRAVRKRLCLGEFAALLNEEERAAFAMIAEELTVGF